MSSSTSGPQDADGAPRSVPGQTGLPDDRPRDRVLLERVLRETFTDDDRREPLAAVDRAALLEVATRHRNQPLSLDPVVVELVGVVLLAHFEALAGSEEFWRATAAEIGQTLWDDPAVRARLEGFWRHLCEMEP